MSHDTFYNWQNDRLVLNVYLQPNASKDEVVGLYHGLLKIRITAAPLKGQANQHLRKFLARLFAVSTAKVELVKGHHSRQKQFHIQQPQQLPKEFISG